MPDNHGFGLGGEWRQRLQVAQDCPLTLTVAKHLHIELPPTSVEGGHHDTVQALCLGLQRRYADGGNSKRKRQTTSGGDRNADAGEISGADTNTDDVDVCPVFASLGQQLLKHRKQSFGLPAGLHFEPFGQNPVAR